MTKATAKKDAKSAPLISSFAPVSRADARVLILGSMPGKASLDADQYYAHPRNLFWPLVMDALGGDAAQPYSKRLKLLKENHIALWDVLAACQRSGSLDSAIRSETPNDFAAFFAAHPRITHVFFNGAKAEESFTKFVRPHLENEALVYARLPSTSPANAGVPLAQKRKAWRKILSA